MMWYSIQSYLRFLIQSTNQHGVHSPFVFDLVTRCLYDTSPYEAYAELETYRKQLLQNDQVVSITDLGPGSKKTASSERRISELAQTSGTPLKRCKLLLRLVQYLKPNHILELGTSLGLATQAMACGNPKAQITSIEGCPNLSAFTKQQLAAQSQITFLTGDFGDHLPELATHTYDLIFFDGNHTYTATMQYFNALLSTAHNDTVFIFDDIYWSKGMTKAWEAIKAHPQVTVTIDTYHWGLVFFRKEQAKEHFKIRL